jgi:quercetin dioxygenase-like cupin family protein
MNQTTATKLFINDEDISWEEVGENVKRKIMAYNDSLMLVKVAFNTGGVGAVHQHYHTQITHVESGLFEIEINGEKQTLKEGDSFFIPPNVPHGAVCLEAGVLIDTFSPMREDFLK